MYEKERLREVPRGNFFEMGTGQGLLSATLLNPGWSGSGYELNSQSLFVAAEINRLAIAGGRYRLFELD
jgi:hypothetical protein